MRAFLSVCALLLCSIVFFSTVAYSASSASYNDASSARAEAMILGGYVADAAAMPLHWIYDVKEIEKLVPLSENPEFYAKPSCPYYKVSMWDVMNGTHLMLIGHLLTWMSLSLFVVSTWLEYSVESFASYTK